MKKETGFDVEDVKVRVDEFSSRAKEEFGRAKEEFERIKSENLPQFMDWNKLELWKV